MNISIISGFSLPVPPVLGGATEKIWWRFARQFAAAGHGVTFVSRTWPGWPSRETLDGVSHRRVRGAPHGRSLAVNLLRDMSWGWRAARVLPPADVVICHTPTLPIWLPLLRPAAGRVAVVLGRVPKGQLRFYGRIARLYATSTEVAAQAAAQCPAMRERIRVIWNPIDWALHAAAGAARGGGAVTIGFAGRLHPEKGIELLLRAAVRLAARSDLPAWRLDLIGPAAVREGGGGEAWRDSLASRFGTALGPRLAFHPAQFAPEKLARFYGAVDIFCYPSLAERGETFGVAVAEAMAAGAAPVVSALACFGDLVRDGETGLVFDHRAADADVLLAAALARLILEGPLRRALGARAQVHVRRFDYPEIAAAILNDLGKLAPPG